MKIIIKQLAFLTFAISLSANLSFAQAMGKQFPVMNTSTADGIVVDLPFRHQW
jgi:hypothetical protein